MYNSSGISASMNFINNQNVGVPDQAVRFQINEQQEEITHLKLFDTPTGHTIRIYVHTFITLLMIYVHVVALGKLVVFIYTCSPVVS